MNTKSGVKTIFYFVMALVVVVVLAVVHFSHVAASPPASVVAAAADDEDKTSCMDTLDELSPKAAADCIQPTLKKVIVLVQDSGHVPGGPDEAPGEWYGAEDGPIQLLVFIGKKGEIVSYNREEFLASPALQILLKRLTKLHKVDQEWFVPTIPVEGSCI